MQTKHILMNFGGSDNIGIKKIAELANVSIATVSKVINGKDENISEATKNRILKIVEEEGYIPNGVAKSLKMKRTKTIGVIVPDIMNMFYSELVRGAEDIAEKMGYSIIICNTDNNILKEEKYIQILQEKMVDGIILASTENGFEKSLAKCTIPVVLVDREINLHEKAGRILVNNEESAFTATDFLIKNGCKNIGFISSGHNNKPSLDRLNGYIRGLRENDIYFDKDKVYQNNYTIETGYKGINILLDRTTLDGIFCGNDLIAIGAIKAIKEKNIIIPQQMKVIGFDDILISKYIEPPLTTMKQPTYKMGEESVRMLIDLICNKKVEKTIILKTELIRRLSV